MSTRTKKKTTEVAESSTEQLPASDVNANGEQTNGDGQGPTPSNGNGRRPAASWRYPVDRGTNVQVALWPNTIQLASGEEIEVLSLTISRSYKDKNGEWVNARTQFSFRVHELPVLQHAIAKAYGYAMDARQQDSPF